MKATFLILFLFSHFSAFGAGPERNIHSVGGYNVGYGGNIFSVLNHIPLCSGFKKISGASSENLEFSFKCHNRHNYIDRRTVELISEFEGQISTVGAGPYVSGPIMNAKGVCFDTDKNTALKNAAMDLVNPPTPTQGDFKMTYRCDGTTLYLMLE